MTELHDNWRALSIQQPWVDLILRGLKTVEVRYWRSLPRRGKFLIHSSSTIDWKTVELLGFQSALELPRQRIVGLAEISDVNVLTNENRLFGLTQHWVMHPFTGEPLGLTLKNVALFGRLVACKGKPLFFTLPTDVHAAVGRELEALGIDPSVDPTLTLPS